MNWHWTPGAFLHEDTLRHFLRRPEAAQLRPKFRRKGLPREWKETVLRVRDFGYSQEGVWKRYQALFWRQSMVGTFVLIVCLMWGYALRSLMVFLGGQNLDLNCWLKLHQGISSSGHGHPNLDKTKKYIETYRNIYQNPIRTYQNQTTR